MTQSTPVSAQSSTTLRGDMSRLSCLASRPRQALDGAQGTANPTHGYQQDWHRLAAWSRSCPAGSSSCHQSVTPVAPSDPAACAGRCWVGGLDGASHAVTEHHVSSD